MLIAKEHYIYYNLINIFIFKYLLIDLSVYSKHL